MTLTIQLLLPTPQYSEPEGKVISQSHSCSLTAAIKLLVCVVAFPWTIAAAEKEVYSTKRTGEWTVVETPNFRCRSQLSESDALRLAESCEVWRSRLRKTWITNAEDSVWLPKCDVCVHLDKAAYNHALNRPGDASVGSTMMNFDQGRTVLRRIDVRSDASDWSNAALPHELTHVVLGERFRGHALPRWADEGIAMLSESTDKHRERLTNLREILVKGQSIRLEELVQTNRLPAAHLRNAFYGQSIALTSLLIRQASPAEFADFIEQSQRQGFENALNQQFKISSIAALQRQWDQWTRSPESMEFVSLQLHDGLTPIVAAASDR